MKCFVQFRLLVGCLLVPTILSKYCTVTKTKRTSYQTSCWLVFSCTEYRTVTYHARECCPGWTGAGCSKAICRGRSDTEACNKYFPNSHIVLPDKTVVKKSIGKCIQPNTCECKQEGFYSAGSFCDMCSSIDNCDLEYCTTKFDQKCSRCEGMAGYEVGQQAYIMSSDKRKCNDNLPPTFINCPETSIVVYAEPRQNTARVSYGNIKAQDNSGDVTVTQIEGLPTDSVFPEGVTLVRYKATDSTGNEAICSFSVSVQVIVCNIPTFDDESVEADCPEGHGLGYECSLSCNRGQPLNGSDTIKCLRDNTAQSVGYWKNSESVSCIERPCLDLPVPANGALACDDWVGASICMMQCQKGYGFPRSVRFTPLYICLDSGQWVPNDDVPDCVETRRPDIMLMPIESYFNGDCSNVISQEEIKINFITRLNNSFEWNGICSNPTDCTVAKVTIECGSQTGRRKRKATP